MDKCPILKRIFQLLPVLQMMLVWLCLRLETLFPHQTKFYTNLVKTLAPELEPHYFRQRLLRGLKAQRYTLPIGPLWFRSLNEVWLRYRKVNRFFIGFTIKVFFVVLGIGGPLCLLLISRGTLPVPERIKSPQRKPLPLEPMKGIWVTKFDAVPLVAKTIEFDNSPGTLTFFKGYRLESGRNLLFKNKTWPFLMKRGLETTVQRIHLLEGNSKRCRLIVKDALGHTIWTSHVGPEASNDTPPEIWMSPGGHIQVTQKVGKGKGHWAIFQMDDNAPFFQMETEGGGYLLPCTFGIGVPKTLNPSRPIKPKQKSWVVIALDGIPSKEFFNKNFEKSMNFIGTDWVKGNYLARHTHPDFNLMDLLLKKGAPSLGAVYPSQYFPQAPPPLWEKVVAGSLSATFANEGAQTGAIGFFTGLPKTFNPIEMGFHDVFTTTNRHFESRITTELALDWLEQFGKSPFFLMVRYGTLRDPVRPPWRLLSVSHYLINIWKPQREAVLFAGGVDMLGEELARLLNGFEELQLNNIGVVVVSLSGANHTLRPVVTGEGAGNQTQLGLVRHGGQLLGEEELILPYALRVPEFDIDKDKSFLFHSLHSLSHYIKNGPTPDYPLVKNTFENADGVLVSSTASLGMRGVKKEMMWWQPWPRRGRLFTQKSPWGEMAPIKSLESNGAQAPKEVWNHWLAQGFAPVLHISSPPQGAVKGVVRCLSEGQGSPFAPHLPNDQGSMGATETKGVRWLNSQKPLEFQVPSPQGLPLQVGIPTSCTALSLEVTQGDIHPCGEATLLKKAIFTFSNLPTISLACDGIHPEDQKPKEATLWWGLTWYGAYNETEFGTGRESAYFKQKESGTLGKKHGQSQKIFR